MIVVKAFVASNAIKTGVAIQELKAKMLSRIGTVNTKKRVGNGALNEVYLITVCSPEV